MFGFRFTLTSTIESRCLIVLFQCTFSSPKNRFYLLATRPPIKRVLPHQTLAENRLLSGTSHRRPSSARHLLQRTSLEKLVGFGDLTTAMNKSIGTPKVTTEIWWNKIWQGNPCKLSTSPAISIWNKQCAYRKFMFSLHFGTCVAIPGVDHFHLKFSYPETLWAKHRCYHSSCCEPLTRDAPHIKEYITDERPKLVYKNWHYKPRTNETVLLCEGKVRNINQPPRALGASATNCLTHAARTAQQSGATMPRIQFAAGSPNLMQVNQCDASKPGKRLILDVQANDLILFVFLFFNVASLLYCKFMLACANGSSCCGARPYNKRTCKPHVPSFKNMMPVCANNHFHTRNVLFHPHPPHMISIGITSLSKCARYPCCVHTLPWNLWFKPNFGIESRWSGPKGPSLNPWTDPVVENNARWTCKGLWRNKRPEPFQHPKKNATVRHSLNIPAPLCFAPSQWYSLLIFADGKLRMPQPGFAKRILVRMFLLRGNWLGPPASSLYGPSATAEGQNIPKINKFSYIQGLICNALLRLRIFWHRKRCCPLDFLATLHSQMHFKGWI